MKLELSNPQFNPFITTESEKETHLLLKESVAASATLWTKNQELVIETRLSAVSEAEKALFFWLSEDIDPDTFAHSLQIEGLTHCYFSIYGPKATLFFKARFISTDPAGLKFAYPEQGYKAQRRKHFRFPIPDGHIMRVEYSDPSGTGATQTKKAIDISAGGIAVFVAEEEELFYENGAVIENIQFKVRHHVIHTRGTIKHKQDMLNLFRTPGYKIGIQFIDLDKKSESIIDAYVMTESRKYLSRFY